MIVKEKEIELKISIVTKSIAFEKQQHLYHNKVNLDLTPIQRLGKQAVSNQAWGIKPQTFDALPLSHRDSTVRKVLSVFSLSHTCEKTKENLLYLFTELKTYHLSYFIYKRDNINIADPSSMPDTCHITYVIDLTHHRVSVTQW